MKGLIIFVAGAAIGAGVTYYFLNETLQKRCDEEIEEVRAHYRAKLEDISNENNDDTNSDQQWKYGAGKPTGVRDVVFQKGMDKINENYISHSKDPEISEPTDEDDEEDIGEIPDVAPSESGFDGPHIISEEAFSTECMNFEKFSYLFYLGDQTLVDEDGVVIDEDAPNTVGTEFMNILDSAGDTIYIRNENISMDFEIVAESGNYYNNEEFAEED